MSHLGKKISADDNMPVPSFPGRVQTVINTTSATVLRAPAGASVVHLHLFGPEAGTLQLCEGAYAGNQNASAVSAANDTWTITSHGFATGDGPYQLTTSGTLPAGLALLTDYWIYVVDANTIKFCLSLGDALRKNKSNMGGDVDAPKAVDITDAGTGTHTVGAAFPTASSSTNTSLTHEPVTFYFDTNDAVAKYIEAHFAAPAAITFKPSSTTVRAVVWYD